MTLSIPPPLRSSLLFPLPCPLSPLPSFSSYHCCFISPYLATFLARIRPLRFALCGSCLDTPAPRCHLRIWDASTGLTQPCALADISLPYPVRALSWHPRQHMLAVAMVGPGAAVAIYTGERESSTRAVSQLYSAASLGLGFGSASVPESSETDSLTGAPGGVASGGGRGGGGGVSGNALKSSVRSLIASRRDEIAPKVSA